ncbi:putative late blight resistance protein R1B-16 [Capsicum galapagoense]
MNDIVLDYSDSKRRYLSMQKMHPFKRVNRDKIDYCPYGLYRALLTPILSLIWLRYLLLQCDENLNIPPEICRLWNLQTFIVKGLLQSAVITFPEEIWGLVQLRHLKPPRFYLPDCPSGSVDKVDFSKLQTISYLSPRCCTKEVILGIQNVKELGFSGYGIDSNSIRDSGLLNNLLHLQQLETLSFIYFYPHFSPSVKAFPATLKKLKLKSTFLSWSYLDIIAELPNLEVLKLIVDACDGREWHPNVTGFFRLKLLLIELSILKYWKATDDNFSVLERLMIRNCQFLKEIPIEFAEIHTLQLIELTRCLPELGESAARIQQEQEDLGNNPVDVCVSNPLRRLDLV